MALLNLLAGALFVVLYPFAHSPRRGGTDGSLPFS